MKTAWSGVRAMTIASLAAAALAPYAAQAAQPDDDPDKVARWLDFKEGTFKGRAIDPHGDAVIKLDAPARAADASVVPIAVNAQFPQTPTHYIRKLYLFIDENPEPYAGSPR